MENIIENNVKFAELGVSASLLDMLKRLRIETPTPIQRKSIPVAISGEDLIGVAQTGTGKTFAFGIPMIMRLASTKGRGLVLLPTRELAMQVEDALRKLGGPLGLKTALLIGGESFGRQISALKRNPHIIIATPGRLIDHLRRRTVRLFETKVLVLDEADMMFTMGFAPQVKEILLNVPKERQTMLFSATMPLVIVKLAAEHMKLPVNIEVSPSGTTVEAIDQEVYVMGRDDKLNHLEKVLNEYNGSILIFCRTKFGAKALTRKIIDMGHRATEIHSNLSFKQRKEALEGFKNGRHRILVGTDIAARGLDVNGIELVLNYDLPDNSEDYVHRIGRTARAGKKGKAISFATPNQRRDILSIERLIKKTLTLTKFAELDQPKSVFTRNGRSSRFRKANVFSYKSSGNKFRRRGSSFGSFSMSATARPRRQFSRQRRSY